MSVTFVTALYDIGRETNGDGRPFSEYLAWIKDTLKIPVNWLVYVDKENVDRIKDMDPHHEDYKFTVIEKPLPSISYYQYRDRIKKIIESPEYKAKMRDTNRVECRLPLYPVVNFTKYELMDISAYKNPYKTQYFFWIDAGLSRFFNAEELAQPFIMPKMVPKKVFIQKVFKDNYDVLKYAHWDNHSTLFGGFFGGDKTAVRNLSRKMKGVFHEMIRNGASNNEQVGMQVLLAKEPSLFHVLESEGRTCAFMLSLPNKTFQETDLQADDRDVMIFIIVAILFLITVLIAAFFLYRWKNRK
jgi:preprotein translocase subunit Sec61beta